MTKSEQRQQKIGTLIKKSGMTRILLAQTLQCSLKTIERDLNEMRSNGAQIDFDRSAGKYIMNDDYYRNDITVTKTEAEYLGLLHQSSIQIIPIDKFSYTMVKKNDELFAMLYSRLSKEKKTEYEKMRCNVNFAFNFGDYIEKCVLDEFVGVLEKSTEIKLRYKTKKVDFNEIVEPLTIINHCNRWLLFCARTTSPKINMLCNLKFCRLMLAKNLQPFNNPYRLIVPLQERDNELKIVLVDKSNQKSPHIVLFSYKDGEYVQIGEQDIIAIGGFDE